MPAARRAELGIQFILTETIGVSGTRSKAWEAGAKAALGFRVSWARCESVCLGKFLKSLEQINALPGFAGLFFFHFGFLN